MGRRPIGSRAMTDAERQKKRRTGVMPVLRRRPFVHDDAERTNSTGHIVARAMEVFEPKFRKWLASNPSYEAKLAMHSIVHGTGEALLLQPKEIFEDEEDAL